MSLKRLLAYVSLRPVRNTRTPRNWDPLVVSKNTSNLLLGSMEFQRTLNATNHLCLIFTSNGTQSVKCSRCLLLQPTASTRRAPPLPTNPPTNQPDTTHNQTRKNNPHRIHHTYSNCQPTMTNSPALRDEATRSTPDNSRERDIDKPSIRSFDQPSPIQQSLASNVAASEFEGPCAQRHEGRQSFRG
jgi:hypothetical protein